MEKGTRERVLWVALLSLATSGCYTGLDLAGGAQETDGSADSEGSGDAGGSGGEGAASCLEGPQVQPTPIRRLSHAEYRRTLRALLPGVEVPDVDLPEDLSVHGFENNAEALNPSSLLIERYNEVAVQMADRAVAERLDSLLPCDPASDQVACAEEFVRGFGLRAFRRPLTETEIERFTTLILDQSANVGSFEGGIELALQAFLQSPSFLYRMETAPPDAAPGDVVQVTGYEMASRLSYLLWQSMPDDALFQAAAAGQLSTPEQVEAQARRMLEEPLALDALVDFHRQWLDFDLLLDQAKEPSMFPEWNDALRDSMYEEGLRFVARVFEEGDGTLEALLTSRQTEVNPEMAALYGVAGPESGWMPAQLDPDQRAGVLTLPSVLAAHARPTNGSPPLRGVFVLERLLCARPPDPPPDADTTVPEPPDEGTYTNRELFEMRTADASCQGCHVQIDGIGFAFEHYDAVGRFRTQDNGLPVDATGQVVRFEDIQGSFDGAIELSEILAGSQTARHCVTETWFSYAQGREAIEADDCSLTELDDVMAESGGDIRELLVAIATSHAFTHKVITD